MNFSVPSDKRQRILYIWKIIDSPSINIDELHNFLTFELFLAPLEEVKKIIREALDLKFLIEDPKSEEVSLSDSLKVEFEKWQDKGEEKIKKIHHILRRSWRHPIKRSKALTMDKLNFIDEISGKIEDKDENGKLISYNFEISPKDRKITHNCPEYNKLRKKQKKLCPHLGRVFIKLNITS